MVDLTLVEKRVLASLEETLQWGNFLVQKLEPGSIVLLKGDLGAGKTSLVQGMGKGLGITEPIVSPTFTLVNEYHEGRLPLYHFDLYRLTPTEVIQLHLEQYWEGVDFPLGIVAIEWPERLPQLPLSYWQVELTLLDSGRQFSIWRSGI